MISTYRNWDIRDQVKAVSGGLVSAQDLSSAVRTDIARYEPRLKAWVSMSDVQTQASDLDGSRLASRPLAGVSVGVKDIIDVAGVPTRSGSSTTSDLPVASDASCVARLRSLGAVIQGKTVTTEFGYFSPGPTVNPWDHACTPGGSSSGSAAAVGARTISVALGTQTAGSLTRPASYCGVAGMVLANGSTTLDGIHGLSESLDSLGLLTRTVADLAYVYAAFDGSSLLGPDDISCSELKLYLWLGSDVLPLSPQMQDLLREVPGIAGKLDIDCTHFDWNDHVTTLTSDHRTVMGYEAARTMAQVMAEHRSELSPQLQELLLGGAEIEEQEYQEALIRRNVSRRALERLLGPQGVIIGPAAQGPALDRSHGTGSPDLSRPWQILGLPVVVVPGARSTTGMPLGLQLIGMPGTEHRLLALGQLLEKWLRRLASFSAHNNDPTIKDLTW